MVLEEWARAPAPWQPQPAHGGPSQPTCCLLGEVFKLSSSACTVVAALNIRIVAYFPLLLANEPSTDAWQPEALRALMVDQDFTLLYPDPFPGPHRLFPSGS